MADSQLVRDCAARLCGRISWYFYNKCLDSAHFQKTVLSGKIAELQNKAEKVRYAWDLAQLKLEDYLNRNLEQVKSIYKVAIIIMSAGFLLIVAGLCIAAKESQTNITVGKIAAASAILTEFISVTFMVIYRSTMSQATQYMAILERINSVGMAVGILDAIKDEAGELTIPGWTLSDCC